LPTRNYDHGTQKKSGERLAPPARTLDGC